jgi:hypothetical protein
MLCMHEDGDSEDMNDKELLEGHEMYNRQTEMTFQTSYSVNNEVTVVMSSYSVNNEVTVVMSSYSVNNEVTVDSEKESSMGDTEGSEYGDSDEEEQTRLKKKFSLAREKKTVNPKQSPRRTKTKGKSAATKIKLEASLANGGRKTPLRTKKDPAIDVEALLLSGGKNSVTTKTMDAMAPDEKNDMIGSAGKVLLKQAKKGMRVQAMTVSAIYLQLFDVQC